jgi:hypothetical protein
VYICATTSHLNAAALLLVACEFCASVQKNMRTVSGKSDAIMTRAHVRENVISIRRSSYSVQVMSHASSLETDSLNLLCGNGCSCCHSLLLTHFVIASLTLGSSPSSARLVIMAEPLPVPKQLATQLAKCKSIRDSNYYKSRDKSPEVRKGI